MGPQDVPQARGSQRPPKDSHPADFTFRLTPDLETFRFRQLPSPTERRRAPRYEIPEVDAVFVGADLFVMEEERKRYKLRVADVSETGAGLLLGEYLLEGDTVNLLVTLPGHPKPFAVKGEVRWARFDPRAKLFRSGLHFRSNTDRFRAALAALVTRPGDSPPVKRKQ